MPDKKFKLTKETKDWFGTTLHRIKALRAFGAVAKGELGGFVEAEKNLAQDGDAWVYGNARVSGNARVYGDARVSGDALVYGDARVYGDAWVSGNARVYGNACVYGNAWVYGNTRVYGKARVSGNAGVYGKVKVDFQLCSRFNFDTEAKLAFWRKLEAMFEKKFKE